MGAAILIARVFWVHLFNEQETLKKLGDRKSLVVQSIPAYRGAIMDRNGQHLAVSAPTYILWCVPAKVLGDVGAVERLAEELGMDAVMLRQRLEANRSKRYYSLVRHAVPEVAERILDLGIAGVSTDKTYKRYYPTGALSTHVLGFANDEHRGVEGLEVAYNKILSGESGLVRVLRDRKGRVVDHLDILEEAVPGRDLVLSLDRRLQYLVWRELASAVKEHRARAGMGVLLDVRSGEVLAMANYPSYNPNYRVKVGSNYRNRAITDLFEPGSTMKPFAVLAGLQSGLYQVDSVIDTSPGYMRVSGYSVSDSRNYGMLDLTGIIRKSSNVGVANIALSLDSKDYWRLLSGVGFGASVGTAFPGEQSGMLSSPDRWTQIEQVTLSYGYGLSVTALQLARAYTVLANDGILMPISLLRVDGRVEGERVASAKAVRRVRRMMEEVVSPSGTARRAAVPGYRIAGKTGTVKKSQDGGYADDLYQSVFVGIAPASRPRLVMLVMIDEPNAGLIAGGAVAAPVFSAVMTRALRIMDIPPDGQLALQQAFASDSSRGLFEIEQGEVN
ncbi:MAG: peptidoglycan D,D-transpeptidase FtsI family protein [Candidatus Eutrophobiaceae bacterium]